MEIVQAIVAVSCCLSILFFLMYVVGIMRLPSHGRPLTPELNRFGEPIGLRENPGFEETEDESRP